MTWYTRAALLWALLPVLAWAKVITPTPTDTVLANPFIGLSPFVSEAPTTSTIPFTLVYDSITWRELEPTAKGSFDWATVEKGWAAQVAAGRKVGFRFTVADPWIGTNLIPDWLIGQGVPMRPFAIDGGTGNAPDWNNATFLNEHDRVIAALGARYDKDPRIAWVDLGSYGIWGEWHVSGNESLAATDATKKRILDAYLRAFPDVPLVIPFDDTFATKYALARGVGVRNDCLGPQDSNAWYFTSLGTQTAGSVAAGAPVAGEFCGSEAGAQSALRTSFDATLSFVKQTGWSWIGPAGGGLVNPPSDLRAKVETLLKTIGYRFVITRFEHADTTSQGRALSASMTIRNDGTAPMYRSWPVALALINTAGTVVAQNIDTTTKTSSWLPGTTSVNLSLAVPASLPAGTYTVAVAILDPNTNIPGVQFANTGRDAAGWYRLSTVNITAAGTTGGTPPTTGTGSTPCTGARVPGFALPCPIIQAPSSIPRGTALPLTVTPSANMYIYRVAYLWRDGTWSALPLPTTGDWITQATTLSVPLGGAGQAAGTAFLATWDWTRDATLACWKGPEGACGTGLWRLRQITIE